MAVALACEALGAVLIAVRAAIALEGMAEEAAEVVEQAGVALKLQINLPYG